MNSTSDAQQDNPGKSDEGKEEKDDESGYRRDDYWRKEEEGRSVAEEPDPGQGLTFEDTEEKNDDADPEPQSS